jgi:hypothetical protein
MSLIGNYMVHKPYEGHSPRGLTAGNVYMILDEWSFVPGGEPCMVLVVNDFGSKAAYGSLNFE